VIGGDHSAPENPDGRLSRLIGSGETGGGPSTPEIRIVGRRGALSKLIGSGETGGGPSTPEIRIVGWRMALSKLIGSGETGGGPSTPEIRIVGWRTALKQADRIRGDRRRSLHSGNPDRRSAGGLRGLPVAVISSESPCGRRFSSFPVPDSGPCSGAKLCDVHWRQ
jgi:hypothetical protein